eukprot:CAMPEP_0194147036 /NCGR_PEP_ID=MMETSP0152-20130528/22482_1 /TAXON_ID=1049557 /ORGANISM="Thalassiothrix antarctica, Strain L6-D1" /LENGTH=112 /DNA_ID=CAMNT_0038847709 /DNA_START=138 /DNA_END=476 /DNA_ORIENTATION=-
MSDDKTKNTHSFVEGSDYFENAIDEVEAMGGDPFFLTDDDTDIKKNDGDDTTTTMKFDVGSTTTNKKKEIKIEEEKRSPTDGKGPMPRAPSKFVEMDEWDGTVDEEAHLGLD